jgi:hypothetical protein
MKNALQIALGIVTSVGGFLEIGSIATAAQAGAEYRFGLAWAVALGGLCLIFLVEMPDDSRRSASAPSWAPCANVSASTSSSCRWWA